MFKMAQRSRSRRQGPEPAGDDAAHGPEPPLTGEPGSVSGPGLPDAGAQGPLQNHCPKDCLSPMHFPDGKNPYLDRPLPRPPRHRTSPSMSSVMPARPSTSGGPSRKASELLGLSMASGPRYDKRVSKDDMFLSSRLAEKKGLRPRQPGLRGGGLPTPDSSPNLSSSSPPSPPSPPPFSQSPPSPAPSYPPSVSSSPRAGAVPSSSIPARMPTPESLTSGEIQIGMALGSPTHPPVEPSTGWTPQAPSRLKPVQAPSPLKGISVSSHSPEHTPAASESVVEPAQRWKSQRRKFFGGLFSRKHTEPAKNSDARDSRSTAGSVASPPSASSHAPSEEGAPMRSNTVADRRAIRHKPTIVRSNTTPLPKSPSEAPKTPKSIRSMASGATLRTQADDHSNWSPAPPPPPPLQPVVDRAKPAISMPRQPVMESPRPAAPRPAAPRPAISRPAASEHYTPMLDVEIPTIKMERYSVMFSNVLNPQDPSAALAKRQAALAKLQAINDRIMREEEERRKGLRSGQTAPPQAAHPQPPRQPPQPHQSQQPQPQIQPQTQSQPPHGPRSPGLMLFPRPPQAAPGKFEPRRSNTSPANLPSPSHFTFEHSHGPQHREKKTVTIVSPGPMSTEQEAPRPKEISQVPAPDSGFHFGTEEYSRPPRPAPPTSQEAQWQAAPPNGQEGRSGSEAHGSIMQSPRTIDDSDEEGPEGRASRRADLGAPDPFRLNPPNQAMHWQMVSPPSRSSTSSGATGRRPPSSSSSSVRTHVTHPSVDTDDESAHKTAVEVSIARQISISRQQRTLLRHRQPPSAVATVPPPSQPQPQPQPLIQPVPASAQRVRASPSNGDMGRSAGAGGKPARRGTLGQNERVADTKAATPRLVVPDSAVDPHSAQHRKSERVIVEAA